MSMTAFLPWQQALASQWLSQQQRFAHAWLIHGLPGIGQLEFALAGAASLLCEDSASGVACGQCQACHWLQAGNHPDFRRIRPDAVAAQEGALPEDTEAAASKKQPSKDIRIEQIRGLLPWFNMATHRGGWRVALLYPAEAMNTIAANALLKILEEPPAHTVFLLVAEAPDRLLPTLVSRCRRLPLPVPGTSESLQWLQAHGVADASAYLAAAGGAPLLAHQLAQGGHAAVPDFIRLFLDLAAHHGARSQLADALIAEDAAVWVDAFQRLWVDLGLSAHGLGIRYYPGQSKEIQALAVELDPLALARTGQWLQTQRGLVSHPLNVKLLGDYAAERLLQAVRPYTVRAQ